MSRGAWRVYIAIGLVFVPLCLGIFELGMFGDFHWRWIRTHSEVKNLREALERYQKDVGAFPSTAQGLNALRTDPGVANWAGPYLDHDVKPDRWRRPFLYRTPEVLSLAGDGSVGGKGDDQDISSLRLDEPRAPSLSDELLRIGVLLAPVSLIGYLCLPWIIAKRRRRRLGLSRKMYT